ncbi:cell cycle checkpoint [Lactarius deliciosus]|nr:cell cycle checkpoint [Lactarius deliciosus]
MCSHFLGQFFVSHPSFRTTIQNVPTFYREQAQLYNLYKYLRRSNTNRGEASKEMHHQLQRDIRVSSATKRREAFMSGHHNLPTDALSTALRSASAEHTGTNEVVMKLAKKKNVPVLSFEIFGTTQMGRRVKVAHDVRIEVMKPADVALLTEPRCPEPDVQIMLPPLTKMRGVVERMRNLSDVIAVRANSSGCLRLSASTEVVKADITWNNCSHPRMTGDNPSQARAGADDERGEEDRERPDPTHLFSVLVHARSLLKFLNAHAVSKTTIACICQGHCLILFVYIGDSADVGGVLTFYIPSVLDD